MRASRSGRTRGLAAMAVCGLAVLGLSACGAPSGAAPRETRSAAAPATKVPASQIPATVTSPDLTVPVGHWAEISRSAGGAGGTAETYVVRAVSVVKGSPGELKDVSLMGGESGPSLKTAVPYFIAMQVAVVKGDATVATGPGVTMAVDSGRDDHLATLQEVTQLPQRCKPAPTRGQTDMDVIGNDCVIAIADPGSQYAPTLLEVGTGKASQANPDAAAVTLALPAPTSSD